MKSSFESWDPKLKNLRTIDTSAIDLFDEQLTSTTLRELSSYDPSTHLIQSDLIYTTNQTLLSTKLFFLKNSPQYCFYLIFSPFLCPQLVPHVGLSMRSCINSTKPSSTPNSLKPTIGIKYIYLKNSSRASIRPFHVSPQTPSGNLSFAAIGQICEIYTELQGSQKSKTASIAKIPPQKAYLNKIFPPNHLSCQIHPQIN